MLAYSQSQKNFNLGFNALSEAEEAQKKIDPYSRSRKSIPLADDAVIIAGTSNPSLNKEIEKYVG